MITRGKREVIQGCCSRINCHGVAYSWYASYMSKKKKPVDDRRWVISASRRTDIPAFFPQWFMERIRTGWVDVASPFGGRHYRVSLKPDDVHSIVFWSKDYRNLLPHLTELEQREYRLFFHYTITGLPHLYEARVPETEAAIETMIHLSQRYSPDHIIWRFDPIVLSDALQEKQTIQRFETLATAMEGHVHRCYISFLAFYPKVQRRLLKLEGMGVFDPPPERKFDLAGQLGEIAAQHGIQLYSCCNNTLIQSGVEKGHCIDGPLLSRLFPDRPAVTDLAPSREGCGCYTSKDIGTYDTCDHGCVYCYANRGTLAW